MKIFAISALCVSLIGICVAAPTDIEITTVNTDLNNIEASTVVGIIHGASHTENSPSESEPEVISTDKETSPSLNPGEVDSDPGSVVGAGPSNPGQIETEPALPSNPLPNVPNEESSESSEESSSSSSEEYYYTDEISKLKKNQKEKLLQKTNKMFAKYY